MSKRTWLMVACVVMAVTMAIGGTLAYLTDTDSATNTMVMGNVDITQNEYSDVNHLNQFVQDQTLLPGDTIVKEVVVSNDGATDAYVRTWVAVERPNVVDKEDILLGWNPDYTAEPKGTHTINGTQYDVYCITNTAAMKKGDTFETLQSVTLTASADSEEVAAIGDKLSVLVFSQGVQTANMGTDAAVALYNAFKDDHPWGTSDVSDATQVSSADDLKNAIGNGGKIVLMDDVKVTETLTVPNGKKVELDLNGRELSYGVNNDGKAAAVLVVNPTGELNITGSGTITFTAADPDMEEIPGYATNTITNEGTLTIGKGVTVINNSEGGASYAVDNKGVFTLDGGTLKGDRCALRVAKYNQDNVVFNMISGTVTAKTPAWIQLPGSDSSVAPSITVNISGGTMKSTKSTSADNDVMYTYSFGNSHKNTKINISGGEFLGGTVSIGSGYKGDAPTMSITGGTFEYPVLQWLSSDASKVIYPKDGTTSGAVNETIVNSVDALKAEVIKGGTIYLSAGTYDLGGKYYMVNVEKAVQLVGIGDVTIKGAFVPQTTGVEFTFEGLTFATDAGVYGLETNGGDVVVRNCTFGGAGYGIYKNPNDSIEVANCTFNKLAVAIGSQSSYSAMKIHDNNFVNCTEVLGLTGSSLATGETEADIETDMVAKNTGVTADMVKVY